MVVRPFPIRISNYTKTGEKIYTGDYGEGRELTWTEINLAALFGSYPYKEIEYSFESRLTLNKVKRIINRVPKIYLRQVLGEDYENRKIESITLLEALELERLMYKSINIDEYEIELIEVPFISNDRPDNTIIDLSENTTVTKMERRIFDLDIERLKENCRIEDPSSLYLNFFQYLDYKYSGITANFENCWFEKPIREYLRWLEHETGVDISALGTGSMAGERITKDKQYIKKIRRQYDNKK